MSLSSTSSIRSSRPAPFTPKRPLSSASNEPPKTQSRSTTPSILSSAKRFKASLSSESRSRFSKANKPALPPIPSTPAKPKSRPGTPGTPRGGAGGNGGFDSPFLMVSKGEEMDVSRVDPEDVLVDWQTVEPGDVSGELDENWLRGIDHGKEDKVMVSIRIRPTSLPSAWKHTTHTPTTTPSVKLLPQYSRSAAPPQDFQFDEVLTGSENKPVYNAVARSHVSAAMDGYNAVIFAYGQTASGKTFTLSGDDDQPGIIPCAMKDVFSYIRRTPNREYLLRCSYLEIYNETIHDLLSTSSFTSSSSPAASAFSTASSTPASSSSSNQGVQIQGSGANIVLTPLREEVVTSLKGVKEVLERGYGNRRTASTDWNERSSRSHSVFRLVIESREREQTSSLSSPGVNSGRQTPSGRLTPSGGRQTSGGVRLQARDGRSVQTSVLSLIDLAGSEKATSDKDRTREGKYINTSLLTLGTVIGTLAENAARNKTDHVPFRNSKLTRMLQPSLSGNARISVICTINPDGGAVAESMSTLLFAQRIKRVQLNAMKKEIVDTDALIERYRKEIEDLKRRLAEREAVNANEEGARGGGGLKRRLSAREQLDESKAMRDLNGRIQQLSKLILTSHTVDETKGDESRPGSPVKVDFDMSPYQLQQELLAARREIESQSNQILSLEAALLARPPLPATASVSEKDQLIAEQTKTIRELEIVVRGYEDNLGEPLRAVREDVEKEWEGKVEEEKKKKEEAEAWAGEVVKALEKEKKARTKLEEERKALAAFVSKFDSLGLGISIPPSKLQPPMPSVGGAAAAFAERRQARQASGTVIPEITGEESPVRLEKFRTQPSLLEENWTGGGVEDVSFEMEKPAELATGTGGMVKVKSTRDVLGCGKENVPAA